MNEEFVPYTCDGIESRKRQKETLQAIRARLDAQEQTEKARLAEKAEALDAESKPLQQRQSRKAA